MRLRRLGMRTVIACALVACSEDSGTGPTARDAGASGGTAGASGASGASGTGARTGGAAGSAGRGGFTADAAGARPGAGGCLPVDVVCGSPGDVCCAGAQCVQATPQPICLVPCAGNADCASGCCLQYGNVQGKVCGTVSECTNCAGPDQACAASTPCCQGSICTTIDAATSCKTECKTAAECTTKCCAMLGNDTRSVCLDPKFCAP